jgi:hypothetical protein
MTIRNRRRRERVWGNGLLAAYSLLIAVAVIGYLLDWSLPM